MQDQGKWLRLRDLPGTERAPFETWLNGQACPVVDGIPMEDQDFYYPWDYARWKSGRAVVD